MSTKTNSNSEQQWLNILLSILFVIGLTIFCWAVQYSLVIPLLLFIQLTINKFIVYYLFNRFLNFNRCWFI